MKRFPILRCLLGGFLACALALGAYIALAQFWLPDTLPFDTAPHTVWHSLIARAGFGNEVWVSVVCGALAVGALAYLVMAFRLRFHPCADLDDLPRFAAQSWLSGLLSAFLFAALWPQAMVATHIGGAAFDALVVIVLLGSLPSFRHLAVRRYSWLAVPTCLLCAAILGLERPAPMLVIPPLLAAAAAIILGVWTTWALLELRAPEQRHDGSTWRKPIAIFALLLSVATLVGAPLYTARQFARADGSAASRLAAYTLVDAHDAYWLVTDSYLAPNLERQIKLAGKGPVLVQTGRNFDGRYLDSLLKASEVMGYRAEDMLSLKVASELSVTAFAEELSLLEGDKRTLARTWSPALWPWTRLTNIWASVAATVPREHSLRGTYVRRMFARAALDEGAAMQEKHQTEAAQEVYFWVLHEVDPENVSAVLNLVGMLNRGYKFGPFAREEIESGARDIFSTRAAANELALKIRMCGTVYLTEAERKAAFDKYRPQLAQVAEVRGEEAGRRNAQLEASLREAMRTSDKEQVRTEARGVLRQDRRNLLGNGVMGTLAAADGDYAVAEYYLKRAAEGNGAPVAAINNYAEVLRRLGKLEPAEVNARRAVAAAPDFWRTHETLADVLLSRNALPLEIEHELVVAERLAGVKPGWNGPVKPELATLALIRIAVWQMTGHELEASALQAKLMGLPLSPEQRKRLTIR